MIISLSWSEVREILVNAGVVPVSPPDPALVPATETGVELGAATGVEVGEAVDQLDSVATEDSGILEQQQ